MFIFFYINMCRSRSDKIAYVVLDGEKVETAAKVKVTCKAADAAASTKVGFAAAAMAAAYYMA